MGKNFPEVSDVAKGLLDQVLKVAFEDINAYIDSKLPAPPVINGTMPEQRQLLGLMPAVDGLVTFLSNAENITRLIAAAKLVHNVVAPAPVPAPVSTAEKMLVV